MNSDEALTFFREWMNSKTKLAITAALSDVVVSGVGTIVTLDDHLFVADLPSRFSVLIPLAGSTFEPSDPERGSGIPELDEAVRNVGFKFGWEIILPSKDRVLIAEVAS
jgi:hypothetical protein